MSHTLDSIVVIVFAILSLLIIDHILNAVSQEADAVTRKNTKKTICVDGVCTTNDTDIGNCPPALCKSENRVTIN
jgi:hypothetical protein